ncbi:thermonuclease family protein [Neobacillus sp. SuZ13]|uniref:thermonuclease family protein n=1 Tax=Neobacillus sp. SuZ13 TaxID=3047875 RepID=UPI0024BF2C02|nr:thermonuclease family protein [Neobacillus sp. SuZ13]WHY69755.1 thermonuclease family protein [Neobacillus sp. SuZ13]
MRKKLTGGAFIVAASLFAVHPLETITGENSPVNHTAKDVHTGEVVDRVREQIPITLVETIDGDTIKARVKGKVETVRYLLVDTPESKRPGMCVQPFAEEAFQRNNELVKDGSLSLEVEEGPSRDSYDRLLAYVYVDGMSVQEMLIKEGYARVAYIMDPPYKYLKLYKTDENLAKKNKLRIWGTKDYVSYKGFIGCVR